MAFRFGNSEETWYDTKELAEKLGIKPQTLRMWKSTGAHPELKPKKLGGKVYYSSANLTQVFQSI